MDAYETILTKRDTREFLPDPVDEGTLRRVLQAGRMAGSAKNSQLNRVVVVTDQDQRERLRRCGKFTSWLPSAPVVLVIVSPTEGGRMVDVGRMAQNMMLAAHALGLASCPMSFQEQPCVRQVLDLPDQLEAPVGVAVGNPAPAQTDRKSSPRIPLDDLVRWQRWSG